MLQDLTQSTSSSQGALEALGYIDLTALAIIAVFSILGLFKGLVWQISRLGTLVAAYVISVLYGPTVGEWLFHGSVQGADERLPLYVAYLVIFIGVLVVLSLLSLLLTRLVEKTGLTFYNRLGGGLVGIGSGVLVVVFVLAVVLVAVRPTSDAAAAARTSRAYDYSGKAVDFLGSLAPDGVREIFGYPPLDPDAPPAGQGR